MVKKLLIIVVDAVLSFIFFIIAAILLDFVAGKIFGTHQVDGQSVLNVNGGVMVVVTLAVTLAFSLWFYRFVIGHKFTKLEK